MKIAELKEILAQYDDDIEVLFKVDENFDTEAEVVTGSFETSYGWDNSTEMQTVNVDYEETFDDVVNETLDNHKNKLTLLLGR